MPSKIVWLMKLSYIHQTGMTYNSPFSLTTKGIRWAIENALIKFQYHSETYNIHVVDDKKWMLEYFLEDMGEDDEWVEMKSFNYLFQWLELTHSYSPKTEVCYIFNPLAIFEGKPVCGIDYVIMDKRNQGYDI